MRSIPFVWLLIPLLCGILLASPYLLEKVAVSYPTEQTLYRIQLTDYPAEKAKTVLCNATVLHIKDSTAWLPSEGNIKLYLQKDSLSRSLQQGDILVVHTQMRKPTTSNPDDFDYMRYLLTQGFSATAYADSAHWTYIEHQSRKGIRALAIRCRHFLYERFQQSGLHDAELGVVGALILGYTEDLDSDTRYTFTAAGAAHILAVSGMHTAIIFFVLYSIATFFGLRPILYKDRRRRIITTWIIIPLLWFYAFLTGLTPSILRSALMISTMVIGESYYFRTNNYNILAAAAFFELVFFPLHLFTASFLLSYFAVMAILYFEPRFARIWYPKSRVVRWLWDSLTVSLAAQIGTIPLTLFLFGQASNYFFLTNIVVLLLSYVVMLLAIPALIFVSVPVVGNVCGILLQKATQLMIDSAAWIEDLPYAVTNLQISTTMFVCFCGLILCFIIFFRRQQGGWLGAGLACLMVFIGIYAWYLTKESKTNRLICFSSTRTPVVLVQEGRESIILTTDSVESLRTTAAFRRHHYLHQPIMVSLPECAPYSFEWQGKGYLLIDSPILENYTLRQPIQSDVLLLGNIGRVSISRLFTLVHAKEVIILPTLSWWKTKQAVAYLSKHDIPFHDTHVTAYETP